MNRYVRFATLFGIAAAFAFTALAPTPGTCAFQGYTSYKGQSQGHLKAESQKVKGKSKYESALLYSHGNRIRFRRKSEGHMILGRPDTGKGESHIESPGSY